mmetsp:Transcript_24662/g.33817  ORF Transcript_24662/g.33817 Transcript_24662/m.33817 type:complete len:608 (-) Transcript_24662:351-2174(-)|eukprot:CAMPEP_0185749002 /NCGR_PEP_ID=MMETSP1174-20130828/7734_1 /TAXON_ID=35687 /ORGANISM="Dictyocha speculum, Strain CCMP1381" /LENGTH=607 /DNA_ID=CAMNT_0028424935 /DNA_START=31 /DNA_END=1854 /DNA_ORIENTATION=-
MELLQNYGSDDEEASVPDNMEHLKAKMIARPLQSAPHILGALPESMRSKALTLSAGGSKPGYNPGAMMKHNPTAMEMNMPVSGPKHPFHRSGSFMPHLGAAAHANGYIAPEYVAPWAFEEQFHTYNNFGYAVDTEGEVCGSVKKSEEASHNSVSTMRPEKRKRAKKGDDKSDGATMKAAKAEAMRELELGAEVDGPWSSMPDEPEDELLATIEKENDDKREAKAEERRRKEAEFDVNADLDRRDERKISHLLPARHTMDTKPVDATSTYHGKKGSQKDYQGRPWIEPPHGMKALDSADDAHQSFIPKKLINRYTGHTKGVQAIRWFPGTGHLLLSAGLDGKVKIWDSHNERRVRRTYNGHSLGVRDVNFTNDGKFFISSSFDRFMRYWDTETGQAVLTLTNRKVPYQCQFHPSEQNLCLMASSDNRLWTWDMRTGQTVQEYNHHIKAVNSLLFCDDGRRFVSTSDDKKVLVWEWNIPVPMKYISDPSMHSIPTTALHPWHAHWVAQSLENEIHVYAARDRFRRIRKKVFRGHLNAGYACQITFSPNGKYMASGDGEGRLYLWDWKSCKQLRRFRCHDDGPCIDAQWHPLEPSWIATAGWDGVIKLWD